MTDSRSNAERFAAFIETKTGTSKCPVCSENEWEIYSPAPITRLPVSDETDARLSGSKAYFPAYVMYCQNCGYVSMHMKRIVDAVGQSDPEETSGE